MGVTKKTRDPRNGQLQCLRNFCLAAQLGSITRAAERASLSQPTISLQIQALERQFHAVLFQRNGPKISLTSEGQALYRMAWPLVESLDGLPEAFQASREGLEAGRLHIAAGESTILHLLPEVLRRYAAEHPGIELKVFNVTGREGLKLLRNEVIDLAVGSLIEVPNDVEYLPVVSFDPYLITPLEHPLARAHRVTIKDVAQYPLILPPPHLTTWRVVDYVFHKYRLCYRVSLEVGGWEVIKRYVELGLGISVVTGICLTGKEELKAIPFGRYFPKRTYGLVLRKKRVLPAPARMFVQLLKECMKERRSD